MTCFDAKRRWYAALLALALSWAPALHATTPAGWKETGFSINATGMTLRQLLQEFGRVYGVRVAISTKTDAYMKGRLKADSGSEFLDRLTQPYKFRWFVYNETLYIVPADENASLRLEVGEDAVQDAKAALIGLGLFDSRFGWGELPDEGVVIVSGPRIYVNMVREVLLPDQAKAQPKGRQLMIFRLKYATATDRVITMRDQSQTIPGVKTILSNLLFGPGSNEKLTERPGIDMGSSKRSRSPDYGKGEARDVGEKGAEPKIRSVRPNDEQDGERASRSKGQAKDERPRIEADPSLNAIIIYDDIKKRDMYKTLIAELDVEPQQVEIEALIVDIDRSKLTELGVEWGVRRGDAVATVNGTNADSKGVDLPIPGSTLLITNAAHFYARLKALEGNGQARVLAKPTVLTLDNVAAVLDLSQTQFVPLVGERVADLANVTAGTMLRVVPRIVREGDNTRVRLEVDIEDGTLGDPANPRANITRSTISTQALIDLQQTLMIGGYHAESVSKNQQKVPLLGDVPLFGALFRNDAESHATKERLFLITPRLSPMSGVAASPRSKTNRVAWKVAMTDVEAAGPLNEKDGISNWVAGARGPATEPVISMPSPAAGGPALGAAAAPPPILKAPRSLYGAPNVGPVPRPAPRPAPGALPVLPWSFRDLDPSRPAGPPPAPKHKCPRPKGAPPAPTLQF